MVKSCERKVMQKKIKCCNQVSRNRTTGYCAEYYMGASSLIAKPGNYSQVCMPFVEKVGRESELLVFWKKVGVCWNVDFSNIMDVQK